MNTLFNQPGKAALIAIIQSQGKAAVSAREFYRALGGMDTNYSRWLKINVLNNAYAVQGEDWTTLHHEDKPQQEAFTQGRPSEDYALVIPFAKKLAMLTRTNQGEKVRDYFIECERQLLAPSPSGLDLSDPLVTATLLQDATLLYIAAETACREATRQLEIQAPAVAFARKVELSPVDISIGTTARLHVSARWSPGAQAAVHRTRAIHRARSAQG